MIWWNAILCSFNPIDLIQTQVSSEHLLCFGIHNLCKSKSYLRC